MVPSPPAFFLAPDAGPRRLLAEDEEHARRVMRLQVGAQILGLDGRGRRVPLCIRGITARGMELEPAGPEESTPAPGEAGAALPWFELAVSWPRKNRVEGMVGRLVQLGVAAILPLVAQQRGPEEAGQEPPARLLRIAREACKQCGRTWMPVFEASRTPDELCTLRRESPMALLDPRAGLGLDTWLRSLRLSPAGPGTRARPITLVVGPEGGMTEQEQDALLQVGASPACLGPHILRVETAAEAAMAIAALLHGRGNRPEETTRE